MLKNRMHFFRRILLSAMLVLLLLAGVFIPQVGAAAERPVWVVELQGTITAGQQNFLQRQVDRVLENDAQLFVVVMNTPGGLVDATMKINETIS